MNPGPSGSWDDSNVSLACVILLNDTLHMWYDANWNSNGSMNAGIGHAKSTDGINWDKDTLNPVLTAGPSNWESQLVSQAAVVYNAADHLFHMWYMGHNGTSIQIGHATAPHPDSTWEKDTQHNPVLSPGDWDNQGVNGPTVVLVNDTLHMFYGGFPNAGSLIRIGHAKSTDWISWQKDPAPVLNPGNLEDWDYPQVRASKVIHDGFRFHLFYTGGSFPNYDVGYVYSQDGTNWTKFNDSTTTNNPYKNSDPVLKKGSINSWDDDAVTSGSVLFNDNRDSLRIWYTGASNGAITSKIGYATAPFDPVGIIDEFIDSALPQTFILNQNYPNPFNPSTTISYQLPKTSEVELSIYNLLGQKVTTLVSKKQTAGSYQVTWDASGFASGIYYCKLQAKSFCQTRKLILLK
jgi:hypothetical protein